MADLGVRVGDAFRPQSAIDGTPALAGVVTAERTRRRDRDEHPVLVLGIEDDRMETHAAGAGRPVGRGAVLAKGGELVPALATIGGTEERGVFGPRVHEVRVGERRLEMPDSLELEGPRASVIPLMRAGFALVGELTLHRLPRLSAVVGALDHLPKPARILRRVQPVRVRRGPLDVVDLPAGEVRAADVPLLALRVRRHDERALVCADQYSNPAHSFLL